MRAHRQRIHVSEDHRVTVELPEDFPEGPADIFIRTSAPESDTFAKDPATGVEEEFARLFAPDPLLSRVVFHEDPTAPLSQDDWPDQDEP